MKIFLVGLPGSGKSSLGREISRKIELPFFDLDDVIEEKAGMKITEIFAVHGEEYFRELEMEVLSKYCSWEDDSIVVATGGGTPCFYKNMEEMKASGLTVYLKVPIHTIMERLKSQKSVRPLLNDIDNLQGHLENLLASRSKWYDQSELIMDSDHTPDGLLNLILRKSD